jgi:hypothetical protein
MQLPTKKTSLRKCLAAAGYTARMLAKHGENPILAALGKKLDGPRAELRTTDRNVEDAIEQLTLTRVEVVYEDFSSDTWLRRLQSRAEIVDGRKGGRLYLRLFPSGLQDIVKRMGAPQLERMQALELRIAAIQDWPDAQAVLAELALQRSRYEAAVVGRDLAEQQLASARIARKEAKERLLDAIHEVAGQIRSIYPRDRRMQDLFFDTLTPKTRGYAGAPDEEQPDEDLPDEADAG